MNYSSNKPSFNQPTLCISSSFTSHHTLGLLNTPLLSILYQLTSLFATLLINGYMKPPNPSHLNINSLLAHLYGCFYLPYRARSHNAPSVPSIIYPNTLLPCPFHSTQP